jgi:microcompartment protein CcmK/EutM
MLLGRVVGEVWASRKDPRVDGMKFLVVRQVDLETRAKDAYVVAVDSVGAGVGELVLVCQGSSARQSEATTNKPVDAVVMAIVDDVHALDRDWAAFDAQTLGEGRGA